MSSRKRVAPTVVRPRTVRSRSATLPREVALPWLRYDTDLELVDVLWCDACKKYESKVTGMKYFSRAGMVIVGSNNHKSRNNVDHSHSDQHRTSMIPKKALHSTNILPCTIWKCGPWLCIQDSFTLHSCKPIPRVTVSQPLISTVSRLRCWKC